MTNAVPETHPVASHPLNPRTVAQAVAALLGATWLHRSAKRQEERTATAPTPANRRVTPRSLVSISDELQLEQMCGELAGRLRRVCGYMPAQEFATLVGDMSARKLRWAVRAARPDGDAR